MASDREPGMAVAIFKAMKEGKGSKGPSSSEAKEKPKGGGSGLGADVLSAVEEGDAGAVHDAIKAIVLKCMDDYGGE